MKRVITLFLACAIAGAVLVAGVAPASAAAATPCSDQTTAGKESKKSSSGHGGMDMGSHSKSMGSKSTKSGSKSAGMSAKHSCPTVAGAREVAITGGEFMFAPMTISATAGEDITIVLTADDIAHDLYVEGVGHVVHAKAGKTAMGGLRIEEPGTYEFWCTVNGHKKAGMTGTITVA